MRKIKITILVMLAFLWKIIYLYWVRITKSEPVSQWIDREVIAWGDYVLKITGIELEVDGKENLENVPWGKSVFFVSNHESYLDIATAFASVRTVTGFIAKKELGKIPLLNFWMENIGCVMIDRKRFTSAIKFMKRQEKKNEMKPLVLFPEGTRSKTGEINDFKPGVLKLAWGMKASIQPIVISGTRKSWEAWNGKTKVNPVKVRLLPAIEWTAENKKDFDLFKKEVEDKMRIAKLDLDK